MKMIFNISLILLSPLVIASTEGQNLDRLKIDHATQNEIITHQIDSNVDLNVAEASEDLDALLSEDLNPEFLDALKEAEEELLQAELEDDQGEILIEVGQPESEPTQFERSN